MFYLTTHSTHFIYGYMASDIWLRTILIVRKETRCRHIGYSFRLTARVLLYAPSHRQDNTYHGLCYTSRGALAGTRNSSMGRTVECLKQLHGLDLTQFRNPLKTGQDSWINLLRWAFLQEWVALLFSFTVNLGRQKKKERNVQARKEMFIFNDTLNTFYLWLYDIW